MQKNGEHSIEEILASIKRVMSRERPAPTQQDAHYEEAHHEEAPVEDGSGEVPSSEDASENAVADASFEAAPSGEPSTPADDTAAVAIDPPSPDEPPAGDVPTDAALTDSAPTDDVLELEAAAEITGDDAHDGVSHGGASADDMGGDMSAAHPATDPSPLGLASEDAPREPEAAPHQTFSKPLTTTDAAEAVRESLAALALMTEAGTGPDAGSGIGSRLPQMDEAAIEAAARAMLRPMLAAWLDEHLPAMVERLVAEEIGRIVGRQP